MQRLLIAGVRWIFKQSKGYRWGGF